MIRKVSLKNFLAIPDFISMLNLVFGFLSIIMAFNAFTLKGAAVTDNLFYAAGFIILALFMDSIDGWVARRLGRSDDTDFGKNMDSLCDIVSFGVAPAVLLYVLSQYQGFNIQYLNIIASLFIVVCGLLRLARFNVISENSQFKNKFIGLPIPAGALFLAVFYMSGLFNYEAAMVIMVLVSLLMISDIVYTKISDIKLVLGVFALIVLAFVWFEFNIYSFNIPAIILSIILLVYVFAAPVLNFIKAIN